MRRLRGFGVIKLWAPAVLAVALCLLPFHAAGQSTGSIVIAQTTDASTLDPAFRVDTTTGNNILHIYDPLMMRGPDMEVVPWLAESVEKISDYVWEVKLRTGVYFTNGEPLNAEAVRFSLERILDPAMQSPMKRWFVTIASIDDVVIVDDYTLHFTTSSLDPLFQVRMTFLFPVPPLYVQRVGDTYFGLHPVGTGPYELVEWVRDDHISLRAKSDYWAGLPPIQDVTFRVIPEELSRVAALLNGEADLIVAISPYQAEFLRGVPGMRIESAPGTRVITVDFDIDVPPADQLKFRQLVSYAIDRDQIVNAL
ncbi:MAG: ABC transporter substrate-binding protein, partial [Gemmatimonadota bacterium]